MMSRLACRRFLTVIASVALLRPVLAQQPPRSSLDDVKQLYESAAYDEALAAIGGVPAPEPVSEMAALLRYRALCLIALDRTVEAELAIDQLLVRDPLYRADPNGASPRFVSLVDRGRNRVIPALARTQYDSAKRDFDDKRRKDAATAFTRVVALLDSPGLDPSVAAATDDLRRLAVGFLELSRAALDEPVPTATAPAGAAPIYTVADRDVRPPVVVRQDLPVWKHEPLGIIGLFEGQIEVVIDEHGGVESATLAKPVFQGYDEVAVEGAKAWRYSPARKGGVPVRFKKRVDIRLALK